MLDVLSPAQVAAEIDWIKQTMSIEAVYGNALSQIGRPRRATWRGYACAATMAGRVN
jgi:hypothetical protein